MSTAPLSFTLEGMLDMCRHLHEAAKHEAALAEDLAGMREPCKVSDFLRRSFANVLQQVQMQHPHVFISSIPLPDENTEAIHFPAVTAQLLEAVRSLAAPTLSPETVQSTWSNPSDAAYDSV